MWTKNGDIESVPFRNALEGSHRGGMYCMSRLGGDKSGLSVQFCGSIVLERELKLRGRDPWEHKLQKYVMNPGSVISNENADSD